MIPQDDASFKSFRTRGIRLKNVFRRQARFPKFDLHLFLNYVIAEMVVYVFLVQNREKIS